MPMSSVPARQLGSGVALGGVLGGFLSWRGRGAFDLGTAGGGDSEKPGRGGAMWHVFRFQCTSWDLGGVGDNCWAVIKCMAVKREV
jgi:hypothetical protein